MRGALERYAQRLWYQTAQPALPWRLLSGLYRRLLGRRVERSDERPPRPVLVVGNLTVGGTGKTPLVMALAELLRDQGLRAAIISRGYGGRGPSRPRRVASSDDPLESGDEPVMLAAATGLPVWVGRRRRSVLEAALAEGAEVIISDDGLQHARMPRSFEVVVIDGDRGLGNGWLLPAGPLRCSVERLAQADAVLIRGPERAEGLAAGDVFELEAVALVGLREGQRRAPDALAGTEVSAVCAIGHPQQFATQLQRLGMHVRLHVFPDHHRYRSADLRGIRTPIVTTWKDAVKLRRLDSLPSDLHVLEVQARLPGALVEAVLAHVREFSA